MLNLRHNQYGVTLIEIMVAVLIFGILLALAAPNYSTWIQNQQTRAAAESILNGIQLARSSAINNNVNARFVLCNLPTSSWQVFATSAAAPAPAADAICPAGNVNEIRVQERTSQEGSNNAQVAVSGVAISTATITFNSMGRVSAGTLSQACVSNPVNPQPNTRSLQINVGAGGNILMCDPQLPTNGANADPRGCNAVVLNPPC